MSTVATISSELEHNAWSEPASPGRGLAIRFKPPGPRTRPLHGRQPPEYLARAGVQVFAGPEGPDRLSPMLTLMSISMLMLMLMLTLTPTLMVVPLPFLIIVLVLSLSTTRH